MVHDQKAVDEAALKALGARGFIRPSARDLQVVVGPIADEVAREMRDSLGGASLSAAAPAAATEPRTRSLTPAEQHNAQALLEALGGPQNLKDVTTCSSRLRLVLGDVAAIDEPALRRLGSRGLVKPGVGKLHLILGPGAEAMAQALRSVVSLT